MAYPLLNTDLLSHSECFACGRLDYKHWTAYMPDKLQSLYAELCGHDNVGGRDVCGNSQLDCAAAFAVPRNEKPAFPEIPMDSIGRDFELVQYKLKKAASRVPGGSPISRDCGSPYCKTGKELKKSLEQLLRSQAELTSCYNRCLDRRRRYGDPGNNLSADGFFQLRRTMKKLSKRLLHRLATKGLNKYSITEVFPGSKRDVGSLRPYSRHEAWLAFGDMHTFRLQLDSDNWHTLLALEEAYKHESQLKNACLRWYLEEKKVEEEAYMKHAEQLLRDLIDILDRILEAVVPFYCFTILPNRHRPPCRTMPWDILPSLVILWGVCWMFYPPIATPRPGDIYGNLDTDLFQTEYAQEADQAQGTLFWNGQDWDWNHPIFDAAADLHHSSISEDVGRGVWGYVEEAQSGSIAMPGSIPWELDNTVGQPSASGTETGGITFPNPSSGASTCMITHSSSSKHGLSNSVMATTEVGDQHQSMPAASEERSFTSQVPSNAAFEATLGEPTSTDESAKSQDRTENSFKCIEEGCQNMTFRYKSDWERHTNKHTRPFKCEVTGCSNIKGFGSKDLLQRHMKMHPSVVLGSDMTSSQNASIFCPVQNCDRSASHPANKPFTRKDNRDDHIRRKHGSRPTKERTAILKDASLTIEDTPSNEPVSAEHQKHIRIIQPMTQASGKRKRVETSESNESPAQPAIRECDDRADIDELKEQVKFLKRELANSKEREEALFTALIQATKNRSNEA